LILDEPTAGVDPVGSRRIRDLILELKQQGITIVVTSHLLEQIQEVCDRVGIMSNGRMVREGPLQELITVETQTQMLIENASPELLAELRRLIESKGGDTRLVSVGRPNTTLEKLFLASTTQDGVDS
jgi:ABC-2 type transport system ATP-binding protein